MITLNDKDYLLVVAKSLREAEREGLGIDNQEGSKWIRMSDTLANRIAQKLEEIAERM
ncbi:hypothetical protein [Paenibacillus chitinolyticus]